MYLLLLFQMSGQIAFVFNLYTIVRLNNKHDYIIINLNHDLTIL